MEEETKKFLAKIINTIAMVLIWMMANVFFGIFLKFGFYRGVWQNWLYYSLAVSTLVLLVMYVRKKWEL
jgi:hypothetical protein